MRRCDDKVIKALIVFSRNTDEYTAFLNWIRESMEDATAAAIDNVGEDAIIHKGSARTLRDLYDTVRDPRKAIEK